MFIGVFSPFLPLVSPGFFFSLWIFLPCSSIWTPGTGYEQINYLPKPKAEVNNWSKFASSKFFFLFIGREPTTWPTINCLQIMVCSCAMQSNSVWLSVWLQIIFCSCVKETVLFSVLRSLLRENGRSLRFPRIFIKKNKLGDRMIKQLLNSVIAKYRDLSVSRRSIICPPSASANNWSARHRQSTIFCSTSSKNC